MFDCKMQVFFHDGKTERCHTNVLKNVDGKKIKKLTLAYFNTGLAYTNLLGELVSFPPSSIIKIITTKTSDEPWEDTRK